MIGTKRSWLALSIGIVTCVACQNKDDAMVDMASPSTSVVPYQLVDLSTDTHHLSISAVGDHLIHGAVYKAAYDQTTASYDFSSFYGSICPLIADSDIRFINLETLMAGESYGLSGYPTFNGPRQGIDDLVTCGFNWFALSSNHSMDKGMDALLDEYHYFDQFDGLITTGVHDSFTNGSKYTVKTINGIDVGFLGYTYGLNGFQLPTGHEYLVDLIDPDKIHTDLLELSKISDIQLVSIHWGNEYSTTPSFDQIDLANQMVEWGADVIIGTHPHVVQPYDVITKDDGSQAIVLYSLGNFISAQDRFDTMIEAMASIDITITDSSLTIDSIKVTPLINWFNAHYISFKVIPYDCYSDANARSHLLNQSGIDLTREKIASFWNVIFPLDPIDP